MAAGLHVFRRNGDHRVRGAAPQERDERGDNPQTRIDFLSAWAILPLFTRVRGGGAPRTSANGPIYRLVAPVRAAPPLEAFLPSLVTLTLLAGLVCALAAMETRRSREFRREIHAR